MSKQHTQAGFDAIEEARLRAEHNANPYYWLSRLPRGGLVRGHFNRRLSVIAWLVSLVILGFASWSLPGVLRNGQAAQIAVWLLLLGGALATAVVAILTWPPRSRQNQKKHGKPRRRKNYH